MANPQANLLRIWNPLMMVIISLLHLILISLLTTVVFAEIFIKRFLSLSSRPLSSSSSSPLLSFITFPPSTSFNNFFLVTTSEAGCMGDVVMVHQSVNLDKEGCASYAGECLGDSDQSLIFCDFPSFLFNSSSPLCCSHLSSSSSTINASSLLAYMLLMVMIALALLHQSFCNKWVFV